MYWPAAGRFVSADTVVPGPGNPQAFNRYAYVRNSPLVRIDPTGHEDCAAGDTPCWTAQWEWNNRWYEAHGMFWNPSGGGWNILGASRFRDIGVLLDTLAEYLPGFASLAPPPGWDPIQGWLGDFFQHEAVVGFFATVIRPGTQMHVLIPGGGWYGGDGWADLVDGNQIWEVKPDKAPWNTGEAYRQLMNYVSHRPGSVPGGLYHFMVPYNDDTILMVRSNPREPGVLYYTPVKRTTAPASQTAFDVVARATLAALLALLSQAGQSGPGYGPVFAPGGGCNPVYSPGMCQ